MNREVLISIINRGRIRFIPVRRCPLCDEYVGYKFVRMCDGSMIPVFSSGCRCCGINNGTLSERTWDEVLDLVKTVQNKPMNERTEEDEFILNSGDYIPIYTKSVKQYTFVRNFILGITNTLYRLLKSEITGFFYLTKRF